VSELLADLQTLVECESPSSDLAAVARSADVVAQVGTARLGVAPERIVLDGWTHLRWRLGSGPSRVLLLGHHDTVWPLGSLDTRPFVVEESEAGTVLRGPGCFDMKAGLVMAFHAAAGLDAVTLLVTGDEELGSPSSRKLIEDEARLAEAALVLEASAEGGALKTERKGVSLYDVRVVGRAAHAGLEPERGVNATLELAHQAMLVSALTDPALGTTVTPTAARAGTTTNTLPAQGSFAVDVRVRTIAEQDRVDRAMRALSPVLPGAAVEVSGGPNRPPLEAAASQALFERAGALAVRLGLREPAAAAVGGASDGNFTAGVGTPTLDGLGAVGGGAHADDEHVLVDELPRRTALLRALLEELLERRLDPRLATATNHLATSGPARP
jgi:glutamate carboxypeptidase